jgi:hypothetical protein
MRMQNGSALAPTLIAIAIGMVLWFMAALFIESREPWDDSAYWLIAYPLALLGSAFLGYSYPDRPWRWALLIFMAQVIAMWIQGGEVGNLWPLTLVAISIIALPAVFVAKFASRFGRRSNA